MTKEQPSATLPSRTAGGIIRAVGHRPAPSRKSPSLYACFGASNVKEKLKNATTYSKAFIADGLLFPGDIKSSPLIELILTFDTARVASRILAEMMLYEHEWHVANPMGKYFELLKHWPQTLLHSNTKSMWPFAQKHHELAKVAQSIDANQIILHETPTTHSYFDAKAVAEFFLKRPFDVRDYQLDKGKMILSS